jgi:hypothetical protein
MADDGSFRRWVGVALIIAAILTTASAWAGQSLQYLLAALLR